jgi:hypothetical protein
MHSKDEKVLNMNILGLLSAGCEYIDKSKATRSGTMPAGYALHMLQL